MSKNGHSVGNKEPASVAIGVLNGILLTAVAVLLVIYAFNRAGNDRAVAMLDETEPVTLMNTEAELPLTQMTTVTTSYVTVTETAVIETDAEAETDIVAETADTALSAASADYLSTDYDKTFYANTLFIGDSISTGLSGFGYMPAENVFAKVGLNPESALSTQIGNYTAVSKAKEMQPERIIIMLGTNGLAYMDASYMAKNMASLVQQLAEASPDSQLCILSIPPVTAAHELSNAENIKDIKTYNADLQEVASDNGCTYIDIYSILVDNTGYFSADYAEADGLHFLGKAYGVMLSYIESTIDGASSAITAAAADIPAVPEFAAE